MKPIWKHIIACVCALAIIAYMVFGLWMSRHKMPPLVCEHMEVQILDIQQRQYITSAEISQLITAKGLNPIGKYNSRIALQPVENVVRAHNMVRTAECYKLMNGDVCLALTQRIPLLRVYTGAEAYFVDTDRKLMPMRASVKAPVLTVTGAVTSRMATQEVSAFAEWLQTNPYWKGRIIRVEVSNPKSIRLMQCDDAAEIILGDWSGYANKLNKLRHWYEADSAIHQNQYKQVDLRFHGQVIGIKN